MKLLDYVSIFITLIIIVSLFILGLNSEYILEVPIAKAESVKTLDSEIDRLSTKYEVASSSIRAIINCESQMYGDAIHYNRLKDGTIWSIDYGPLQINDYYHEKIMKDLGLNIKNQWESLEYGFMLFKSQGSKPWNASSKCWSKII